MPKSSNQKLKLWYLYQILFENTDENNPMTMPQLISELERYGISAERKALYNDIELLVNAGVDIVSEKRDKYVYYIASRDFQVAELKLLVDCVQASKFITVKKSAELISKLEGLASNFQATELQRQVYINDRVKTYNEKIYYNIDFLYSAINSNKKISFKYYRYNTVDSKVFRNDGKEYIVSPYFMVYSDDNYYMVAHYPKRDGISHFRVDKMTDIKIIDEKREDIKSVSGDDFNIAEYTKKFFNMYNGDTKKVSLLCDESIIGVVIDRFGDKVHLRKESENQYYVTVNAGISPTFFSWVFMLGNKAKIISPEEVVLEYKKILKENSDNYKKDKAK